MSRSWFCLLLIPTLCGCMESLENQAKKSDSIVGKKTQDVGKFDPNAGNVVSESKVVVTDPILGGAQAYGPMMEQISKLGIDHAINLFHVTNDRYPKDYDEFMTEIIKANNIQLPVLPGGKKYQYDEANHKLVVIDAPAEAKQ